MTEIKDSMLTDDGKNEMLVETAECDGEIN